MARYHALRAELQHRMQTSDLEGELGLHSELLSTTDFAPTSMMSDGGGGQYDDLATDRDFDDEDDDDDEDGNDGFDDVSPLRRRRGDMIPTRFAFYLLHAVLTSRLHIRKE